MKKIFMYSTMLVGLFALQACDKAEKPKEEAKVETPKEDAATLFSVPQSMRHYEPSNKSKELHKTDKEDKSDRMKAFGF